jgi:hypothetical protein
VKAGTAEGHGKARKGTERSGRACEGLLSGLHI